MHGLCFFCRLPITTYRWIDINNYQERWDSLTTWRNNSVQQEDLCSSEMWLADFKVQNCDRFGRADPGQIFQMTGLIVFFPKEGLLNLNFLFPEKLGPFFMCSLHNILFRAIPFALTARESRSKIQRISCSFFLVNQTSNARQDRIFWF